MMSLWDALRMNMMISYQELVRTFLNMSVWYMDIDTTANYKLGGAQQHDSVRLDPWVFMFSAGYRF